ncbi:MAG TPA: cytochrome c maturation protein CcmE [Acidimicrobiales bacterium]
MELTPRTYDDDEGGGGVAAPPRPRRTRRRWLPLAVLAVVVLAVGGLLYKGLSDAALYFRNADEAVAQRDSLGDRRFRLQGTVVGEPATDGDTVSFDVAYNGVEVPVVHRGTPPEMFRPGIPVVLEGRWRDGEPVFDSDEMLVKHDESYESRDDYDERLDDAEQGGGRTGG